MKTKLLNFTTIFIVICSITYHETFAQLACQNVNLPPIVVNGSIAISDPLQTGRLTRDGRTSGCPGKTNNLFNATPVRYKLHNFTNPTAQTACVTVDTDFTGCGSNAAGIAAYSNFVPGDPAANLLGDLGFGSLGVGSFSFSVNPNASFTIVVYEIVSNTGCPNYSFNVRYSTNCKQPGFDWNNDGKADLAMFRSNGGLWRFTDNISSNISTVQWGASTDIPIAGDYTGDGRTDVAIFRPTDSTFWYRSISDGTYGAHSWGLQGDIPVPGDYDGDGKTDVAIFRPSTGIWYILRSSNFALQAYPWGGNGDIPVPGDYDGDRKSDIAIFRPSDPHAQGNSVWYALLSNFDYGFYDINPWGIPTDKPVQADYDGDGKTDIAVYRPSLGIWFYFSSADTSSNRMRVFYWGISEDNPQPADYDGDGKADPAVFRPSSLTWYVLGSSVGFRQQQFGENGEQPVTTAYRVQ